MLRSPALEADFEIGFEMIVRILHTALAAFLSLVLAVSLVPAVAFADDGDGGSEDPAAEEPAADVDISSALISGINDRYVYTGKPIEPAVTLTIPALENEAGEIGEPVEIPCEAYSVAYSNNINVGTATVSITAVEGSGYTGSLATTFEITKKPLTSKDVALSGLRAECAYTGSAIKPSVSVKVGNIALKQKTDYSLSYKNNVKVGKATLVVTFVGNYSGSLTKTFAIVPAKVKLVSAKGVGSSFIVTWKKRAEAAGYKVRYATKKNMVGSKSVKVANKKKTKLTVRGLARDNTYYIQVRAYKGSFAGEWSSAKAVKMSKLGRGDLTSLLGKATNSKSVKAFNSTYNLKKTRAGKRLVSYVNKLKRSHKVSVVMIDLKTGEGLACAAKRKMYSASCLKGPYVASLNKFKPSSKGASSGLMRATVVNSNNNTYASLRRKYGSSTMKQMHAYSGVGASGYERHFRYLPTRDLARLWVGTYWYFYKDTNSNSAWCRSLYTKGSKSESFLRRHMSRGRLVYNKYGAYPTNDVAGKSKCRNDAGVVFSNAGGSSHPYVLAIMSNDLGGMYRLGRLAKLVDAVHTDMLRQRCEY